MKRTRSQHKDISALRRADLCPGLHKPTAAVDINQLHTVLPVDRYLSKIPRNSAGINIERKTHRAMVLGFLQGRLIVHELFLLMLE